jgi:hypothetical protein
VRVGAIAVVAALLLGLTGCGDLNTDDSDCNGSILFEDVVYVVDNRLDQSAAQDGTIGPGAVVDCDKRTVVDEVVVSRVKGVESRIAIRVVKGDWRGVYVAEGVPRSSWPEVLAAP